MASALMPGRRTIGVRWVETDKATVDFEATDDTVLAKILVGSGTDGVKVGQLIGYTVEDLDEYKEFVVSSPLPRNLPIVFPFIF